MVARGRRLEIRKFNVEGRHACSGSRRLRLRSLMQGFGWITDMPPPPRRLQRAAIVECSHYQLL